MISGFSRCLLEEAAKLGKAARQKIDELKEEERKRDQHDETGAPRIQSTKRFS